MTISVGVRKAENRLIALEKRVQQPDGECLELKRKWKGLQSLSPSPQLVQIPVPILIPPSLLGQLDSAIISKFSEILPEFHEKWFTLLWRGSCDNFQVSDFHLGYDDHKDSPTLILEKKGNSLAEFWICFISGEFHILRAFFATSSMLCIVMNCEVLAIFVLQSRSPIPVFSTLETDSCCKFSPFHESLES